VTPRLGPRAVALALILTLPVGLARMQAQARPGVVRGRVRIVGPPPGNSIIRMGMDPKCADLHRGERVLQESVALGPDGGLANAFVRLEGRFPATPVPREPVVIDQRACLYRPRVVGMRVGQRLQIRNGDDVLHNVHGSSAAGTVFNVGQPKAGLSFEFVPTAEDVMLRIGCDVHGWMTAYVGVLPHPYFAVSDARGAFDLPPVPPGTYTVRVWHERLGELTKPIVVTPGTPSAIEFSYTAR
jgi:hypothetical protein